MISNLRKNNAKHIFLPFFFVFVFFEKNNKNNLEWNAWMLYNANPRKTKKTKQQRKMVTKSRAMKHKDHESQRRTGTQNHTNYLMKCLKLNSIKRLGEDVSILTFSRDIYSRHIIFLSTRSLMKWYLISMCLVLECWTGFLEISIALEFSQ